jgi:hypothetical protein
VPERIKLSPDLLTVWEGIQEHKTPTEIGREMGVSRAWVNVLIDQLIEFGLVFRAGDVTGGASVAEEYSWMPTECPVLLAPDATLHLEYVPESQRDRRVKPITRVSWWPWDIQALPMLRPDGRRTKERTPDTVIVAVTGLSTGEGWQFRASTRRRWSESDTRRELGSVIPEPKIPDMTRNIAAAIHVQALFDLTGKDLVR